MGDKIIILIQWVFILYLLYEIRATNKRWIAGVEDLKGSLIKAIEKLQNKVK